MWGVREVTYPTHLSLRQTIIYYLILTASAMSSLVLTLSAILERPLCGRHDRSKCRSVRRPAAPHPFVSTGINGTTTPTTAGNGVSVDACVERTCSTGGYDEAGTENWRRI